MPIATICQRHRALIPAGDRCPACTRERNAEPHRVLHRGAKHARIKTVVIARDGACVYCGETEDLTCDYVVPLALGGEMSVENAVAACLPCNSSRGARVRR